MARPDEFTTGNRGAPPTEVFGEKVMFMHTPVKSSRDEIQTGWDTGCFVGINLGTTEYFIAKEDGVFICNRKRFPVKEEN